MEQYLTSLRKSRKKAIFSMRVNLIITTYLPNHSTSIISHEENGKLTKVIEELKIINASWGLAFD